jgi:hypothetical protein
VERGQALADVRARTISSLPAAHERLAGLEDQRLDLLLANSQHLCDFVMRLVAELEQHQRGALVGREPLHVLQHLAQFLAPLDLIGQAVEELSLSRECIVVDDVAARAQLR